MSPLSQRLEEKQIMIEELISSYLWLYSVKGFHKTK